MAEISTIEGLQTPTDEDQDFMDYLNGLWDVGSYDFGMLLFKGDPVSFRIGRDEWLAGYRPEVLTDAQYEADDLGEED